MTEVYKPGVNNRLKCCSEPGLDLTIWHKVHVHNNTSYSFKVSPGNRQWNYFISIHEEICIFYYEVFTVKPKLSSALGVHWNFDLNRSTVCDCMHLVKELLVEVVKSHRCLTKDIRKLLDLKMNNSIKLEFVMETSHQLIDVIRLPH